MLIVWIITTGVFVYFAFNKGTVCLANPLTYGVNHLSEKNDANLTCECIFSNEPLFILKVNKDKMFVEAQETIVQPRATYEQLNITFLEDLMK